MYMRVKIALSVIVGLLSFLSAFGIDTSYAQTSSDWYMAGANPARTSWVSEEPTFPNHFDGNYVLWYRPIEAYIPQHVQLVTVNDIVYVSTGRGLYALNANNGQTVWTFNTQLPLGNSPTVFDGIVYVGGFDHQLYALNANSGVKLWSHEADGGFSANPIVIRDQNTNNQTLVLVGNRDGYFYAIGGQGHPQAGQVVWRYSAGSPLTTSAAYANGIIYFSDLLNRFYALRVSPSASDRDVWVTLPQLGEPYASYWPVVFRDKVVFGKSESYRDGNRPGSASLNATGGQQTGHAERRDVAGLSPDGTLGTNLGPQSWSGGYSVVDMIYAREYLEEPTEAERISDPAGMNRYGHKPWRRQYFVINQSDGSEYTWDSDHDGLAEYLPVLLWRAESGPMYPPAVGGNGLLYIPGANYFGTPPNGSVRGYVSAWNPSFPNMLAYADNENYARDEPNAISMGGRLLFTSLCCDRLIFSIPTDRSLGSLFSPFSFWRYTLGGSGKAPGYDEMWYVMPVAIDRHQSTYVGALDWYGTSSDGIKTMNATYNSHGSQNSLVPHRGKLFIHRSNAIVALGTSTPLGKIPYLPVTTATSSVKVPNLTSKLDQEVQKMISAGLLKPGYHVQGQFALSLFGNLTTYFENPGDTLLALSLAYPHISDNLKSQLAQYLSQEVTAYWDSAAYSTRGWTEGVSRHPVPQAPEVERDFTNFPKVLNTNAALWQYPQINLYALWKYAQNVPESQRLSNQRLYQIAKSKVRAVPNPPVQYYATLEEYFTQFPYEHNGWIGGYIGYLNLQRLTYNLGSNSACTDLPSTEQTSCTTARTNLDRILPMRTQVFSKDSSYAYDRSVQHKLDTPRNYIWMTQELADYLVQQIPDKINQAMTEIQYLNQYWFVSRFENDMGESSHSTLWNYGPLFQAKAWLLKERREELVKYLDVPAFERGDLFYIQNLVTAIEAPSSGGPTATPIPIPGDANSDGRVDGVDYVIWLSHFNQNTGNGARDGDFNNDRVTNGADYVIWITNYTS